MKAHTSDIITDLSRQIPLNKLRSNHFEYATCKHEGYLWDDIDYKYAEGDMLYCVVHATLVPLQMDSFLLLGWYEHTTLRTLKIPSAANFYLHKLTGKVYVLPKFESEKYCLAIPYPCLPEDAFNFIESGNDLFATYRPAYKNYIMSLRKSKIDTFLNDNE